MAYKKEDYICLSAMLRARETKLLTDEKAIRCIDAASFDEAAKILVDCGYEDMGKMNADEIVSALSKHLADILDELKRLSPDSKIVDLFLAKNDYHNVKSLIKGEAMNAEVENLLSYAGRVTPEKLDYAFKEEKYSDLSETLAKALCEAKDVLAKTSNPQKADFILDKAYFSELKDIAGEIKNEFINDYISFLIDQANLKTLIRCIKMGKNKDFICEALISGGTISTNRLLEASDADAVFDLFEHTPLGVAAELGKDVIENGKMTSFELACDNAVNAYLRKTRLITYGPEAIVSYIASAETEVTAVRMILTCRLAKVKPEIIKERLRDMYA